MSSDVVIGCHGWLRTRMHPGSILMILVCTALLAGCDTTPETAGKQYETLQEGNITIHLPVNDVPGIASIRSFFNANIVMIGPIRVNSTVESGAYWLEYPSINVGASPLYSHRVRVIVPPGFPVTLEDLVKNDVQAILVPADGSNTWKLVGQLSTSGPKGSFDWFADRPDLQFKP